MAKYRITWQKNAYSYVNAKSRKEAIEKATQGKDYDWDDPEDNYGSDVAGWIPVSAEEEEEEEE